jgi:O-antigen/teichoic acid export membrane protein
MLRRALGSRFLKDSAWLQASGGFTAFSALASSVIVSRLLGDTELGRYYSAISLFSLGFLLLSQGLVHATVGQLAMALGRGDTAKAAGWIAFLVKGYVLLGLVVAIVGSFVFPLLGDLIAKDHELGVWASWLAWTPLLELGRVTAYATFQGARRMRDLAILDVVTEASRFTFVALGAWYAHDGAGPILGTVIATAVSSMYAVWAFRRVARSRTLRLPSPREVLRQAFDVPLRGGMALGFRIGMMRSIDALSLQVLPPLIIQLAGRLVGMSDPSALVGHFRIAQRIMAVPMTLMQGFARTTLPALSAIAGRGDAARFRRQFFRVTAFGGLVGIAGAVVSVLVLPWIVRVYSPEFHEPVARLGGVIAIAMGVQGFAIGLDSFYLAAQKLRVAILISVVWFAVSVPATFFLVWFVPSTGVAWGIVTCYAAVLAHLAYITRWFQRGGAERAFAARAPAAT